MFTSVKPFFSYIFNTFFLDTRVNGTPDSQWESSKRSCYIRRKIMAFVSPSRIFCVRSGRRVACVWSNPPIVSATHNTRRP